jgi:hypothetical protein
MLDFRKFENVFGIKKLNNCALLSKKPVTVIYAPNGTMKSSFSDAMRNIKNGQKCVDIFSKTPAPADYDIVTSNGTHILPDKTAPNLNVIVFSGGENFDYSGSDSDMSKLVVPSDNIRSRISAQRSIIEDATAKGESLIESAFQTNGKPIKNLEGALAIMDGRPDLSGKNLYQRIISDIDFSLIQPIKLTVKPQDFIDSANEKIRKWAEDPKVKKNIQTYAELIGKVSNLPIFKNNFSLNDLEDIVGFCDDHHYFDAEHQLYMNCESYDKARLDTLIKSETEKVYGSLEAKNVFEEVANTLDNNPQRKKFKTFLTANPQLAAELGDFSVLTKKLFMTILDANKVSIQMLAQYRATIINAENEIKTLANDNAINSTKIHEIWEKFKSRFFMDKFELTIENKVEAVSGVEFPTFVKKITGTNTLISDPKECRLCTGETRLYYLINLIIEVELMKLKKEPFCLVLDDVADSFDYKNKYGIIEYLDEISEDKEIQIIVLTHNFDFFRSLVLSIKDSNVTQLFAYKNNQGEVTLSDVSGKNYYLELSSFNNWSANPTIEQMFAEIPFIRNVCQFETNSKDKKVKSLDRYMHYDGQSSETLDFAQLSSVLSKTKRRLPTEFDRNKLYLKTLLDTVTNIVDSPKNIDETDLSQKITIGIFIRVFMERIMCKAIGKRSGKTSNIEANSYKRTRSLFTAAKQSMTQEQIQHYYEAQVISPPLVHANSFMYESLIDAGSNALVSLSKWLINENRKWPFYNQALVVS